MREAPVDNSQRQAASSFARLRRRTLHAALAAIVSRSGVHAHPVAVREAQTRDRIVTTAQSLGTHFAPGATLPTRGAVPPAFAQADADTTADGFAAGALAGHALRRGGSEGLFDPALVPTASAVGIIRLQVDRRRPAPAVGEPAGSARIARARRFLVSEIDKPYPKVSAGCMF